MNFTFYVRKFNELSEYIYFYGETVNNFEAMRKIPTVVLRADVSLTISGEIS